MPTWSSTCKMRDAGWGRRTRRLKRKKVMVGVEKGDVGGVECVAGRRMIM
jgi:hypothetical protein